MQGKGIAISTARGRAENTENASNNLPTDSTTAGMFIAQLELNLFSFAVAF